jgi:nitrile hydratase
MVPDHVSTREAAVNGIHDMGGMHGFGPVEREEDEPVFHAPWEGRVLAVARSLRGYRYWTPDEGRHGIERMDPAGYLAASYYERWLSRTETLLVEKGVLTREELAARAAHYRAQPDAPLPRPGARIQEAPAERAHLFRRDGAPPRFKPGDRVAARNTQPRGHTRLPRYVRGKRGVIELVHGVFVFPDTNAHGRGESPQPVYSVRFSARELWGDGAEPNEHVNLDLWESYLLPG